MSVDTSSIDLVALIERESGSRFSKASGMGTKRTQKAACPFCGGTDRFAVFVSETPQRFICGIHGHGCGAHGDAVTFLQSLKGLTFPEACQELNIELDSTYTAPARKQVRTNEQAPSKKWLERAKAFSLECKELLWSETGLPALQWLRSRGLTDETIDKAGIGYNLTEGYQDGALWGMEDRVWISRGITIPWAIDGEIWKINIRRGDKDIARARARAGNISKYMNISGGTNGLYGFNTIKPGQPLVIVEGEIDRLSLLQATNRSIAVVATGSTGSAREAKWIAAIQEAAPVLIAFDDDESNNAGDKGSSFWLHAIAGAVRWLPWLHDVNEMLQNNLDIMGWLETGLAIAAQVMEEELEPLPCCICGLDANLEEEIFFYDENGALYCPLHWQERTAPAPELSENATVGLTDARIVNDDIDLSSLMDGPVYVGDVRVLPSWYSYTIQDRAREKVQELEEEDRARRSQINKSRYTQAS